MAIQFSKTDPKPIPAEEPVIKLPKDHYAHAKTDTPSEWWWHMGTLIAGDRTFGFEINAARFGSYGFTQVSLTDVDNKIHYKECTPFVVTPNNWAEEDAAKPWHVKLANVLMHSKGSAHASDSMRVTALLLD